MSTGQGTTWVLVADGRHARVLEVEDAGLPPRLRSTVQPPPPEGGSHPPEHGWTHGPDPHPEHERQRFVHALVQMLEHGAAENRFRNLVLVAEPHMLGLLRDALPRGLADRLRKSIAKDWTHLPDTELAEQVRPLVEIWPP
ncbi:MAG: host attachment protein [Myxococcaceae bacterium]